MANALEIFFNLWRALKYCKNRIGELARETIGETRAHFILFVFLWRMANASEVFFFSPEGITRAVWGTIRGKGGAK